MPNTRNHPRASRQVPAAIGHLTWTTIIVIGAPIALARFFGWPLPGRMPDWGEVLSTTLQLVDPIVILNLFVCIAWICWAIVMAYVALDIADAVRGVGQRLHRIGPFGTIAAKLVGSFVLLMSLARPIPSLAASAPPTPIVQMIDAPASITPASQAEGLLRGTLLSDVAADAAPMAPTQPVFVVQRGDNLWAIAEAHLGSGFRWTEIHDLNRDFIADPNLICTGWQLKLPADANLPAAPPPAVEEPAAAPLPQREQAAPPTTPDSAPSTTQDTPTPTAESPSTAASELPQTAESREMPTPQPTPTGDSAPVPVATASDKPSGLLPSLVTFVPGISGATVLATSLLLLLRRVRRRNATQGTRPRRPVPPLERALVAAADVPLVRWAGQELAMLGEQLAGRRIDANPVAVEFSEDAGLELLWDRPFPDAPAPWEAVPGGWAWRLLYDPEEPVPHPERSALIAGLVTVGHRDGRQLLVDLEAFGSLSITGDENAVHSFLRALLLELGAGDEVADVYVAVEQGAIAVPSAEHLPRLQVLEPSEVRQRLAAASASTAKALARIGSASTFAYRIYDTPVLPLEVIVTITETSDPDDTAALVASSPPRCGVAAILLGDAPAAGAHLHIGADGTARLEPLGVTFQATGITAETETAVADLLADLPVPVAVDDEEPLIEEAAVPFVDTAISVAAADQQPDATSTEDLAQVIDLTEAALPIAAAGSIEDESWDLPAPRLLVRVLGQPELVDGPDIGRRELVVVACMACLERPTRQGDIQEAVWGGEAVEAKTVWNIVTRARAQLGQWDGEPILSKANRPENTFRLANGVWTDLQVLRALVDRAAHVSTSEAMQLLRDALALVHGPPFDADGYEWARVNQHVLDAERLIEHAAITVVGLALDAGTFDLARYAVLQGLRGLPGNEILYRARMRIEDSAGNATAVRAAYNELLTYLGDLEASPSLDTTQLYGRLVSSGKSTRSAESGADSVRTSAGT